MTDRTRPDVGAAARAVTPADIVSALREPELGVPRLTVVAGAPGSAANFLLQAIAAELQPSPVVFLTSPSPGEHRTRALPDAVRSFTGGGADVEGALAAAAAAGPGATLIAELTALEERANDRREQRDGEHLDAVVTWARRMRERGQQLVVRVQRPPDVLLSLVSATKLCVFATPVEDQWRAIAPGLPSGTALTLHSCAVLDWPSGELEGMLTMPGR